MKKLRLRVWKTTWATAKTWQEPVLEPRRDFSDHAQQDTPDAVVVFGSKWKMRFIFADLEFKKTVEMETHIQM